MTFITQEEWARGQARIEDAAEAGKATVPNFDRLCIYCRYAVGWHYSDDIPSGHEELCCNHPKAPRSLVTGDAIARCRYMRDVSATGAMEDICGPAGYWWEPRSDVGREEPA